MNKHYQEHHDDVLDIWLDLDRMSIVAWATEVAAGGSPEPSAIQNPDKGLPDDEPLPLCLCGSHVCACPTTSEPVHIRIGPMIPLSSNPVAAVPCPRSCGCSCRVQEVAVACPMCFPMARLTIIQICDAARLKATHFVIMSAIRQLQGNTPYGAMPSELQE